jgi:hypothetical protein
MHMLYRTSGMIPGNGTIGKAPYPINTVRSWKDVNVDADGKLARWR